MCIYIRANATFKGLLVLEEGIYVGVGDLGQSEMIVFEGHRIYDMVPECCVAGGGLELVLTHEEPLAAAHTRVYACILSPPVAACERPLSANALSNIELLRR